MNSYTNKPKNANSQSAAHANSMTTNNSAPVFQLQDNRSQNVIQQKPQNSSTEVVQLKKYYRWTSTGSVVECSRTAYRNLSSSKKATEADYFEHNPRMQAEMEPKVSRTYETEADKAANAGKATRQRSQSIHVPTRNRSGSVDVHHTHDNINTDQPAVDRVVAHIDRTGARTGRPAQPDSRPWNPNDVTKPEE